MRKGSRGQEADEKGGGGMKLSVKNSRRRGKRGRLGILILVLQIRVLVAIIPGL